MNDYSAQDSERWLASSDIPPLVATACSTSTRVRALAHGVPPADPPRHQPQPRRSPEDMVSVRAWVGPRRVVTMRRRIVRTTKTIAADLDRGAGPRDAGELVAVLLKPARASRPPRRRSATRSPRARIGRHRQPRRAPHAARRHRRRAIALRRFLAATRRSQLSGSCRGWTHAPRAHRRSADRMTRTIKSSTPRDRCGHQRSSRLGSPS